MNNPEIIQLYSQPQAGGELPYFVGKQYGSGWLKTIARMAFPILRSLGIVAANTATDVIMNDKKILPSLKSNAINEVNNVLPSVGKILKGQGKKRKIINKRAKQTIFQR